MSDNMKLVADPAAVDEQHKAGKLTARERVEKLLDDNSFVEIGCYVQHSSTAFGIDKQAPGDGVITGYGTIDLRPVYIYAQDFTVFEGSLSAANAQKICKTYEMALKNGVPVIAVLDSAGARIQDGVAALDGYAKVMRCAARASGVIPQICVAAGPCVGASAVIAGLADFVYAVEKISCISMTGAQILASQEEKDVSAEGLGGAAVSVEKGLAHFACASEEEAFASLKALLNLLPSNNVEDAPYDYEEIDDFNRPIEASQDAAAIASMIADNQSFLEVQKGYGNVVLNGFAKLGGRTAGIVAITSGSGEGRLGVADCIKAARFIRFCDSFNIPVVSLIDSAGFAISTCEEKHSLTKHASQLAYAYAEATVPLVSVIVGKAIGGVYAVMGSHGIGADVVYAYPNAVIAPLNGPAAVTILMKDQLTEADPVAQRKSLEKEYEETYASPAAAAKLGSVDDVIEPAQTRQMVISALDMQASKREVTPSKRHGNLPL
ncbi:MAG: acyl-CoA carboxylase subunit beta [Christensenellales bacterium]|jgi:acetyl-CoA carboxylase carboxyltransferase component